MTRNLVTLAIIVMAFLSLSACSKTDSKSEQTKQLAIPASTAGALFTAADLDGNLHPSSEWLGKQPTVINYWGTWCPPCRKEIPDLVKIYEQYRSQGVALVSLAVNDEPSKVRDYTSANGMNWVHLIAEDHHLTVFGKIQGVPTTIFFDKNGKEVKRLVGAQSYEDFQKAFQMILQG
jgi:thiol-disulfide isomerase/thioredoxin